MMIVWYFLIYSAALRAVYFLQNSIDKLGLGACNATSTPLLGPQASTRLPTLLVPTLCDPVPCLDSSQLPPCLSQDAAWVIACMVPAYLSHPESLVHVLMTQASEQPLVKNIVQQKININIIESYREYIELQSIAVEQLIQCYRS